MTDSEIEKMIEEKRQKAIELRERKKEENLKKIAATNSIKPIVQSNFQNKMNNYPIKVNSELSKSNTFKNESAECKIWPNKSNYTQLKKRPHENENNQNILQSPKKYAGEVKKDPEKKTIKLSIQLESRKRFKVMVGYSSEIQNIFRQVPSKLWDPITKVWSFSIKDYNHIIQQLKSLSEIDIKFENLIHDSVIKCLTKEYNQTIDLKDNLDENFINSLYPFQKEGIIFGIQRNGKCLIADDMGLGKTIQAIGLAKWYRNDWPLLIICPSSLRFQWKNSILKWMPEIKNNDIFVAVNIKDVFPKIPITITSYDILSRIRNRFSVETNRFYRMIIMDESHYIKSETAQRTSTIFLLARSCSRIILLSGTPALSRPMELFPQLNVINNELFPSKHVFGLRYCDAQLKMIFPNRKPKPVWNYDGAKNLDELKIILENTIMIRRLKNEVWNEIPDKKREMISLSIDYLTEKEKAQLSRLKKTSNYNQSDVFSWFTKTAEAKLQAVNEYLSDLLTKNVKFICFCHHQIMLDGVQRMLNEKRVNHIRIDGSTVAKERQKACDKFQTDESYKVALLSITACATGLNLTASSMVIFTEVYWNPGILAQAEDRAHRIGQSKKVQIYYLISRNTIDELIWPMLNRKLEILNQAGLCKDTFKDTANPLDLPEDQSLLSDFLKLLEKNDTDNTLGDNKNA